MPRYTPNIELDEEWAELLEQHQTRLRCGRDQLITAAIKRYLVELEQAARRHT